MFSERKKIPAAKFNEATKIAAKISSFEISVDEILSGEIGRGENIMHQNLPRQKFIERMFRRRNLLW